MPSINSLTITFFYFQIFKRPFFLKDNNLFLIPDIKSVEIVMEYGIQLNKGRIFSDVWDIDLFSGCAKCKEDRKERLIKMNLDQEIFEPVKCTCDC